MSEALCGFDEQETYRLKRRYKYLRENEWESLEDFLLWAQESGVFKGAYLLKKDESKPHGPENSYWSASSVPTSNDWRTVEANQSPFCVNCEKEDKDSCGGCEGWREWFVRNWNENIHRDLGLPKVVRPEGKSWAYENPDIKREMEEVE